MNIYQTLLIPTVILALLSGTCNCKGPVSNSKNRVIGGQLVESFDQFRYVASLQILTEFGFVHGCSGSICGSSHIITAAHCLDGRTPDTMLVLVGTIELNEKTVHPYRGQFFRVKKLTIHEDYDSPKHDIGIVEIIGHMNFQCTSHEESLPARVGMSLAETKEGTMCTTAGWGFVQTPIFNYNVPNTLRWAKLPIYNHDKCVTDYSGYGEAGSNFIVLNGTICAGYEHGGTATCFGDSGGGLVCNGVLAGVVSFGSRICGEPTKPGVFTDIFKYLTWIAKHGCTLCSD